MKRKVVIWLFVLSYFCSSYGQSIDILSFNENPLNVNPLVGANLSITYEYTSESGSTGNHMYFALEILDSQNNYVSTVVEKTLLNQTAGADIYDSVELFVSSHHKNSSELPSGQYYQTKAILYQSGGWNEIARAGHWDTPSITIQNNLGNIYSPAFIYRGADISWMTEMEDQGFTWKDNAGNTKELMPLLKEYDMNAIRLRVWVDPDNSGANGWCDIDDLVVKAEKAKANGMEIMICTHYSDWWADPGKQNKPAAWANMSVAELEAALYSHTTDILQALAAKNITPKWFQVGNETDDGMLWPTGKASQGGFLNYAKFLNAGSKAVKDFNSNIQTILHISNGNNNDLYRWNIDNLLNSAVEFSRFDVIGMSLYPSEDNWITMVDDAYNNMVDLKSRYQKDVMLVEVGYPNERPDISYQFLVYAIEKTKQAGGLGVLYWEPIARSTFTNYAKGAWDDDGSPSIALDAFVNKSILSTESSENVAQSFELFPNPTSTMIQIKNSPQAIQNLEIFDINGRLLKTVRYQNQPIYVGDLKTGVYLLRIKKAMNQVFIKR